MPKLSELPYGPVQSAVFKLIQRMGDVGDGAQALVDKINSDESFVERVAKLVLAGGYEPSTSHPRARDIMGKNMFGIEEAVKHFGVNPTKSQLAYLAEIPFSAEVLEACKKTHVLVAVFQMSILDIRAKFEKQQKPLMFCSQDWYDKQDFAQAQYQVSWRLIRKEPVANSTNKTWSEQQALLSKEEETPMAHVMVYMIIGHFLATGERLFEKVSVCCVDLDSDSHRVYVGYFDARGLDVDRWRDNRRNGSVGVASARTIG